MVPESQRIEFRCDGKMFYYDFNEIEFQHVNSASVLFNLNNEQKASPPKTDKHIEQSGMLDIEVRALAFLLRSEQGKFNKSENIEFLNSLKGAENYKNIILMKQDFFAVVSIVDAGLLLPFKGLITAFAGLNSEQIKLMQTQQENNENSNSNVSNASISPESKDDV